MVSRAPARGSPVHVSSRWTRRRPGQRHGHHRQHAARAGEAAGGSAAGSGAPGEARRRAADERGGGRRVEAAPAVAGRGWWSPAARMVPSRASSRVGARAPDGALPARLRPGGATSHIPAPRFARDGVRVKRGRGGVARAGRFSCPARSVGGTRTAQPCRGGKRRSAWTLRVTGKPRHGPRPRPAPADLVRALPAGLESFAQSVFPGREPARGLWGGPVGAGASRGGCASSGRDGGVAVGGWRLARCQLLLILRSRLVREEEPL